MICGYNNIHREGHALASEHLLAKMTAKGILITGGGGRGVALISAMDVSASLAGLPDHCYWLARSKYCGDNNCSNLLWRYLQRSILATSKKKITDETAKSMALAALYPVTVGVKCKYCMGTGVYRYKQCKSCEGRGHGVIPDYLKASLMQVSRATYSRRFKATVERLESEAWEWDDIAIRHLYTKYFGKRERTA